MSRFVLKNGNVVFGNEIYKRDILIDNGIIEEISEQEHEPKILDCSSMYIVPGFIDTHTHGCGGFDFMDSDLHAYEVMSDCYLSNGVTTVFPTSVSSSNETLYSFLDFYQRMRDKVTVNMPGVHLEGPFISSQMRGAHNIEYVHAPKQSECEYLLGKYGGLISMITAAPEIEGDMKYLIEYALKNNIIMSLGHSAATAKEAIDAFKYGFKHVTHMYCATTSNRKIGQEVAAGIIEAAYLDEGIYIELIGDGKHIPKETMQLALKIKTSDKVHLVSDSMRAAGTNVCESYLGEKCPQNRVIIEEGVAKLPDRTSYAGSVATGAFMFKNAIKNFEIKMTDAVKMLSTTPSKLMGLHDRGEIAVGKRADILVFDKSLTLKKVIAGGKLYKEM